MFASLFSLFLFIAWKLQFNSVLTKHRKYQVIMLSKFKREFL